MSAAKGVCENCGRGEPPAEPAGIEDITAVFPGWEIVLTTEGRWQATLTTGLRLAQPRHRGNDRRAGGRTQRIPFGHSGHHFR
jgi:hypothetical protein